MRECLILAFLVNLALMALLNGQYVNKIDSSSGQADLGFVVEATEVQYKSYLDDKLCINEGISLFSVKSVDCSFLLRYGEKYYLVIHPLIRRSEGSSVEVSFSSVTKIACIEFLSKEKVLTSLYIELAAAEFVYAGPGPEKKVPLN